MKEIIMKYILQEYGENADRKMRHFSYCMFPEEECSCKRVGKIDYDTSLIKSGIIDSFEMVTVLVFVESKFDIDIPLLEATPENFDTISNIVKLIERCQKF